MDRLETCLEYLANEGYRPKRTEDDTISFKAEGSELMLILPAEAPALYVLGTTRTWTPGPKQTEADENGLLAILAASEAQGQIRAVKIKTSRNEGEPLVIVFVMEGIYLDPSHFCAALPLLIEQVNEGPRSFAVHYNGYVVNNDTPEASA